MDGRQSMMWTALPGIVQSVDFSAMTCEVQPSIQGTVEGEDGNLTSVNLPLLVDVPIVFPGAGGFLLTFPLGAGDEVLVVFASRCIDAWFQSGGVGRPMEARMHDLSDGFAIPGPRSLPKVVSGISTTAAVLRNDAGTASIEIDPSGTIKITGNLMVTGNITTMGQILGGTVSLETHVHSGVVPGGGSSGPPV